MRKHTYYKVIRVDYEDSEYLRITNTDTVTGNFNIVVGESLNYNRNIDYSLDGVNWTTVILSAGSTNSVSVPSKGNVYLRGTNIDGLCDSSNESQCIKFSMDTKHNVSGNIMSLIDYQNMSTITESPTYSFSHLFYKDIKLISVENMNFGNVTNLECYSCDNIFYNCENLINSPDFSSINNISDYAFNFAFADCYNLVTPPDLSNIKICGQLACYSMYYDCYNLQTVYTPSLETWNKNTFANWVVYAGSEATGDKIMYTTETLKDLIPSGDSGYGNYTVTVK